MQMRKLPEKRWMIRTLPEKKGDADEDINRKEEDADEDFNRKEEGAPENIIRKRGSRRGHCSRKH